MKKLTVPLLLASSALASAEPSWVRDLGSIWRPTFLGIELWQWFMLLVLVLVSLVAKSVAKAIIKRLLKLRAKLAGRELQPREGLAIWRGTWLVVLAALWKWELPTIELPLMAEYRLTVLTEAVFLTGGILVIYGLWDAICDTVAARTDSVRNAEKLLVPVTRKLGRGAILVVGGLIALGEFGVDWRGLLAGLGIGGLVVALAAKDSVENIFGSITILFDMPFALGDWVKIDKVEGVIEEINLRSTRIRTFEDSIITLPNSNLIKAAVENYGARRTRRQKFFVRVAYDTRPDSIDKFCGKVLSWMDRQESIVKGKSQVRLNDLTETSIGVLVECYFEVPAYEDEVRIREALLQVILKAAQDTRIIFVPAPHPKAEG